MTYWNLVAKTPEIKKLVMVLATISILSHFISHHFKNPSMEEISYRHTEINNNHCDNSVNEELITDSVVNKSNKNSEIPLVVVNQNAKHHTIFSRNRTVLVVKSYTECLTDNSSDNDCNIKIFRDSIPKLIRVK